MAEATFVQDGLSIDYTPGADVAAGTVVVQADLIGITKLDIKANKPGALTIDGVFDFAKAGGSGINVGTILYWDDTNNVATATASGNKQLGKAVKTAASADTLVRAKLSQ